MERPAFITNELLDKFCDELVRNPKNELVAAIAALETDEPGLAIQLIHYCSEFAAFSDRQLKRLEDVGVILPPKNAISFEVLSLARNSTERTKSLTEKEFGLRAYRLYAEMEGLIDKGPGSTINIQNNVDNRIMKVPADVSMDAWEAKASKQQERLIADAREKE